MLSAIALLALAAGAVAQPASPDIKLYVFDTGTLIYNNPETYNLNREEVKNTNMSVPAYLIVHPKGTLLFDAGLGDRFLGRPFNETTLGGQPNPPGTSYFVMVTQTLKSQMAAIGYTPDKVDFLALSHPHGDHVGNANDFAASTWLVQQGDYTMMFGPSVQTPNANYAALKTSKTKILEGDYDVFGDGTVILIHTTGHTPGHQSLYVKLARTGGVVLSGDLYHYPEERALNRMPDREKTLGTPESRAKLENFLRERGAELWIEHDINQFSRQKMSPQYYD
jgi:glyoxylase-like metal-dependent hydrolase (beta-lactamase superfamily II)